MTAFLVRRSLAVAVVLFLTCVLTFLIFFWLSPDPAVQICGKNCSPDRVVQIRTNLGLDQPLTVQFWGFFSGLFTGRTYGSGANAVQCAAPCLGYSFQSSQPVVQMLLQRLPVTVTVAVGAAVLWLFLGLVSGLVAAITEGRFLDRALTGLSLAGLSVPNYVLALALQYLLVVQLQVLPFPQAVPFTEDPAQWFLNFVMPWTVLALGYASVYQRLTRANVIDTLQEDFVRTAWAKGLSVPRVWARHALRPALTPVVTIFGLDLAGLLGGALITETVFGINGIGKLTADSIVLNDQPVIMAVTLLAAALVVVGNAVVDVVYTVIDPRVRIGAAR